MRFQVLVRVLPAVLLLGGCQSYRSAPPRLDAHAQAWRSRSPDAEGVRSYATSLARLNPGEHGPFDVNDGLSLEEGEVVALLYNAELRVARLDARVPLMSACQAGILDDPEFNLDILRALESVPSPWILGTGLGFTIPISGRLSAEKTLAFAEADAARSAAYVAEIDVITRLREAWNQWTTTGERIRLLDTYLEGLQEILRFAHARREAKQIGEPELRILELERVRREGELITLRNEEKRQVLSLKKLMGLTPDAELTLLAVLSEDAPPAPPQAEQARLRAVNPELALADSRYREAERALQLEIRKQVPDLRLGLLYENEEGEPRLGVGGGSALPLWNRNRRAVAESRAERDAARGAYQARYEQLVAELADARADLFTAAARDAWVRERVAPMADQQLQDLRRLGELGDLDVLILKDALTGVLEAKFQILDARLQKAQASTRIRALIQPPRTPTTRCSTR
mgnify:CR=1 FL=1